MLVWGYWVYSFFTYYVILCLTLILITIFLQTFQEIIVKLLIVEVCKICCDPLTHSYFRSDAPVSSFTINIAEDTSTWKLSANYLVAFFKSGPSSLNELKPHNWYMSVLRSYLSETSEGSDHFSFTNSCGANWGFSYNCTLEFHVQLLPLPSSHFTSECCFTLEFVFQRTLFKYQLQLYKK